MIPHNKRTSTLRPSTLRSGAVLCLALLLTAGAAGQNLRLEDVLRPPQQEEEAPAPAPSPTPTATPTPTPTPEPTPAPDPLEPLREQAREARALVRAGNAEQAAVLFEALIAEDDAYEALQPAGVWAAGDAFLQTGDAAAVREALALIPEQDRGDSTEELARWYLLESLLLEDDEDVEVPASVARARPLHDGIQLRRALVLFFRGEEAETRRIVEELSAEATTLSRAEADVLARLAEFL